MKHFLPLCLLALCLCCGCNIVRDPAFIAPTATPIPVPPSGGPVAQVTPDVPLAVGVRRPVSEEEARAIDSFWTYTEYVDMQSPGEQDYEVTIPPQTHRQSFSWCADSAERLQEILVPVTVAFFIDGTQIDDSLILQSDEGICHQWDMIIEGWTVGQTVETAIVYNIATPIFDGALDYEAGTYVQRIVVTVGNS